MNTTIRKLTPEQIEQYESQRLELMVPDPWSDPFCVKIGLTNMYITETISELIQLRMELEPGVKLNCVNPSYEEFHELLGSVFKNKGTGTEKLEQFIEEYLKRPLEIVVWDDYVPDIRLLETVDEAISWLRLHIDS